MVTVGWIDLRVHYLKLVPLNFTSTLAAVSSGVLEFELQSVCCAFPDFLLSNWVFPSYPVLVMGRWEWRWIHWNWPPVLASQNMLDIHVGRAKFQWGWLPAADISSFVPEREWWGYKGDYRKFCLCNCTRWVLRRENAQVGLVRILHNLVICTMVQLLD